MLEAGDNAPDFALPNQHGETVRLDDFEGQHLIVYFYPRANTEGCTVEACEFRDARPTLETENAAVVGISDDPVSDLEDFAADYDLEFDLLSDEDGSVSAAYDSYGEKQMFGNTFDGVFRNTFVVGPDGTIEAVFEGVTPEGHADEVLNVLE
ncbi:thioredoxin-dependent thiol peroxidase [Natronosalvus rutilus]|uniref:thioredoxin-dependent peroxiredoxin n=1 Tax=Natronosalvus rutilus TaxID=2953753 RepID=A0A9E7NDT4_9EURY|nr:thioredoxin-dependent thiol peroxidase [Natronosalvus rutilus]UTF55130.1 thioredoxin-dependent thiol peroxidase [Natronosalvus rutilus]